MWLIDTQTFQLEYFLTCPVGQYAILSHRWEEQEVSFDDFHDDRLRLEKKGFWKIKTCCRQARARGLQYAWIDTCCIDQKSSAEMSEAINSMYRWYACAEECYAYMNDVDLRQFLPDRGRAVDTRTYESMDRPFDVFLPVGRDSCEDQATAQFVNSKWFSRGWTLQELLAPKLILFFGAEWSFLGTKEDLAAQINAATGIESNLLLGHKEIGDFSVAQRMAWAARRKTSRVEDIAYCLLGIFDVNIPLLYGEAEKAFVRLQEAIIQSTDDETIFAWTGVVETGSGMLAAHPSNFIKASHIIRSSETSRHRPVYSMTQKGLQIPLERYACAMNTYMVPLRCTMTCSQYRFSLGIFLCYTASFDRFRRVIMSGSDLIYVPNAVFSIANWSRSLVGCVRKEHNLPRVKELAEKPDFHTVYVSQANAQLASDPNYYLINVGCKLPWIYGTTIENHSKKQSNPLSLSQLDTNRSRGMDGCDFATASSKIPWSETTEGNGVEIPILALPLIGFGIKRMRVGFDIDFYPICLISTTSGPCVPSCQLLTHDWESLWRRLYNGANGYDPQGVHHTAPSKCILSFRGLLRDNLRHKFEWLQSGERIGAHIALSKGPKNRPGRWNLRLMESISTGWLRKREDWHAEFVDRLAVLTETPAEKIPLTSRPLTWVQPAVTVRVPMLDLNYLDFIEGHLRVWQGLKTDLSLQKTSSNNQSLEKEVSQNVENLTVSTKITVPSPEVSPGWNRSPYRSPNSRLSPIPTPTFSPKLSPNTYRSVNPHSRSASVSSRPRTPLQEWMLEVDSEDPE